MQQGKYVTNELLSELLIVGGAYAGLCLSLAIKQYRPSIRITIIDARSKAEHLADNKCHAIAPDCVKLLEKLKIWDKLSPKSQPILTMEITDSRLGDVLRPTLLDLSHQTNNPDLDALDALAYMVESRDFMPILYERAAELGIEIINNCRIVSFDTQRQQVSASLDNGQTILTKLLIAADGKHSYTRKLSGIKTYMKDYKKSAIICTIKHERPHEAKAIQHFFAAGPFAILPLQGRRSSLVWTESTAKANELLELSLDNFLTELGQRFGRFLGHLQLESSAAAYALDLILPHSLISDKFMLIGDAAHTIHPLCGQGLNLGLRDCATAAQIIVETSRIGLDIGDYTSLENYQRARRLEPAKLGYGGHFLHQLFTNDNMILRQLRDFGLDLVNRSNLAKGYFINQASGKGRSQARLLQGKDI